MAINGTPTPTRSSQIGFEDATWTWCPLCHVACILLFISCTHWNVSW